MLLTHDSLEMLKVDDMDLAVLYNLDTVQGCGTELRLGSLQASRGLLKE